MSYNASTPTGASHAILSFVQQARPLFSTFDDERFDAHRLENLASLVLDKSVRPVDATNDVYATEKAIAEMSRHAALSIDTGKMKRAAVDPIVQLRRARAFDGLRYVAFSVPSTLNDADMQGAKVCVEIDEDGKFGRVLYVAWEHFGQAFGYVHSSLA
ncbi:MAG: hypothetical protein AAFU38_08655 [Bacteroidota bacterium]